MAATATAPTLVHPQTAEFWNRLGIFPDGLTERDQRADLERKAKRTLTHLGLGNLRFLCEQAQIPRGPNDGQETLATTLMASSPSNTLIFLREFLQKRYEVVEETFAAHFPEARRRGFEGDITSLSNSREQLKSLTKLILLYRLKPELLSDIFYLKLSRMAPASYLFEPVSGKLPHDIAERIEAKTGVIEYQLKAALGDRPVRFHGCHTLPNGLTVVAFDRQYSGVVRPDYQTTYTLHFGFGRIILCIHPQANRVELWLKNQAVANTLLPTLNSITGVMFRLTNHHIFRDYDPTKLTNAILGDYPEASGLFTTGVKFRRSALPNQAPVSVEVAPHAASIREDLAACQANGTIQLRSLLDVEHLTLMFDRMTAQIAVERSRNGYITDLPQGKWIRS